MTARDGSRWITTVAVIGTVVVVGSCAAMLARGVYLAPSAYEAGFVSAAHGPTEIGQTIRSADSVFARLKDG